jgi:hypothetical protein
VSAWLALLPAPAGDLAPRSATAACSPPGPTPTGVRTRRPAAATRSCSTPTARRPDQPALAAARPAAAVRRPRRGAGTARGRRRRAPRCASTFTVDSRHFAGSLWVPARGDRLEDDPFRLLGRPELLDVGAGLLGAATRLVGPAQERYAGAPWPARS